MFKLKSSALIPLMRKYLYYSGPIKYRLLAIIILISVPVTILLYQQARINQQEKIQNIIDLSAEITRHLSFSQRQIIDNTRQFLSNLADDEPLKFPQDSLCSIYLESVLDLNPTYINIGVPLANGDLICNALPLNKKVNVFDRPYIQQALKTKSFSISEFQLDRAANKVSINFAYPVLNGESKKVSALVVAVVSLDWWSHQLGEEPLPENSIAYIADTKGSIVAHYPFKEGVLGHSSDFYKTGSVSDKSYLGDNQYVKGNDEVTRVFTEVSFFDTNKNDKVSLVLGVPIDSVIAESWQQFYQSLLVYGLVVLFSYYLFYVYLRNSIVIPVEQLVNAAKSLEEGKITNLNIHQGADEIKLLKHQFKKMADARLSAEGTVWKQANFDVLTKLPNRNRFYETLGHAIESAKKNDDSIAVLFIDVDQFKEVNDTLGHHVGDELLKVIAERLQACARDNDTVARLGGDEFTIILQNLSHNNIADSVALRILKSISQPTRLGDEVTYISASIGISHYPQDSQDIEGLVKQADQAMFVAKRLGRNRYQCFHKVMQDSAIRRRHLITDLRAALENQQLQLYYQPIIDCRSHKITKAEALLRWNHPGQGLINPSEFITLAEETGLIFSIGTWVMEHAIDDLKILKKQFGNNFQLSVNVSPLQFMNANDEQNNWLQSIKSFPDNHSIIIEITEGLLMDASVETKARFKFFAEKGIEVAIDDFGTGYSSLAYINEYDIDFLKVDKSFVDKIAPETDAMILCEAIIVMAHKLGIEVVAEGVEIQQQYQLLKQIGCDYIQGYYVSKPIPLEELISLISSELLLDI